MHSFSNKKQLKFVITLGTGKFGSSENDTITLVGFRASVDIDKAGGVQMSTLKARINGVKQADMDAITTLQWRPDATTINTVDVFAIDGDIETLVFSGNIVNAWGDYQSMPDVFLYIHAQAAFRAGLVAVQPLSIKGGIDAAVVFARIAKDMGLSFEGNGVSVMISNVYLAQTLKDQALELARACNLSLYIDDKTLAITRKFGGRAGEVPLISAASGMVGYPTFDATGVGFQVLFNPAITFGGKIQIETDIVRARGVWNVSAISHKLESERAGGNWFSLIRGTMNEYAIAK
jgi:hypothetical protein